MINEEHYGPICGSWFLNVENNKPYLLSAYFRGISIPKLDSRRCSDRATSLT